MRKSTSGFTIVEVLVIIVVIGILAAIGIFGFSRVQMQQRSINLEAKQVTISSAQESYFQKNGEYLSSRQLAGPSNDGRSLTASDYESLAATLGTTVENVSSSSYKFSPAVASVGVYSPDETGRLYLLTKDNSNPISAYHFTIASTGCSVTFPVEYGANQLGATAYALTYFHEAKDRWVILKSQRGTVEIGATTSSPSQPCQFD